MMEEKLNEVDSELLPQVDMRSILNFYIHRSKLGRKMLG